MEGCELLAVIDGPLLEVGHDQRANCLANAKNEDQDAFIVDEIPTKTAIRSTETIIKSFSAREGCRQRIMSEMRRVEGKLEGFGPTP